jgi:hypothetical protein
MTTALNRLLLLAACSVLAIALMAPARAAAASGPEPPTPELIDRAADAGKITMRQKRLLLARAIGGSGPVPEKYTSSAPWDGTLPLLNLRRAADRLPSGPQKAELVAALAGAECSDSDDNLSDTTSTTHFAIDYDADVLVGGPLTIGQYKTSLEESWNAEITTFHWGKPPVAPGDPTDQKYYVRLDDLTADGLYGFVSPEGSHAGRRVDGNNPNTSWFDHDAHASCMVLNNDYTGYSSDRPQSALDSTTAHEFNHSIQFGYGALTGPNPPDSIYIEGGATWMEDEAQDTANDNYLYLWPHFEQSMGEYSDDFPYPYWITFRGLTERYGTGGPDGAGEQVMQDFWELRSEHPDMGDLAAMQKAIANRGQTTLAQSFHDYAIAVKFDPGCSGDYDRPFCLLEGPGYVAGIAPNPPLGQPPVNDTIATAGAQVTRQIEDNYSIAWVALPASDGVPYDVALSNPSAAGKLRFTVACDTGSTITRTPEASTLVGPGGSVVLRDTSGCSAPVAVITNENQTSDNPSTQSFSAYTVSTSAMGDPALTVGKAGTGTGTVTSDPAGIDCGEECGEVYPLGTIVTLTAAPAPGSAFVGWGGACSGASIRCTVEMSAVRTVTARFMPSSDADPPETTITSGPPDLTPDATPTFRFVSDEPNSSFRCRLDGVPYVVCFPPFTADTLSDGPHRFQVFAVDPSGNADGSPATLNFTVDPSSKPDVRAPKISRLSLSPRSFRAARSGDPISRLVNAAVRTASTLSLRLSEKAQLKIVLERKVGKRWKRQGALPAQQGKRGANRFRLRGRLAGRALAPGAYRLAIKARDLSGNQSRAKRIGLRIVR